jgi:hypothetical protein
VNKIPVGPPMTQFGRESNQHALVVCLVIVQSLKPLALSVQMLRWIHTDGQTNRISPKAGLKSSENIIVACSLVLMFTIENV